MSHTHAADLIRHTLKAYAAGASARMADAAPDRIIAYGDTGESDLRGDLEIRLRYLSESLAIGRVELFQDHLAWSKIATVARQQPLDLIDVSLEAIIEEFRDNLPEHAAEQAIGYIEAARGALEQAPTETPSELEEPGEFTELAQRYLIAVLETRGDDAVELVLDAFDAGAAPEDLFEHVLARSQREIGRMWQMAELHIAEEHFASRIAERVLAALHERTPRDQSNGHRVLCATPSGELHDFPCRVVASHFEWRGWTSLLLGASMPVLDMLLGFGDLEAEVLAVSASSGLEIRTIQSMVQVIRHHSEKPDIPVLVGGRPFNVIPDLWQTVGADAYAPSARLAPDVALALLESR